MLPFPGRRHAKDSAEIQAARRLLASAANGIPTIHAPLNRVLLALGLEHSRTETPAEKIARIQTAVDRHDAARHRAEAHPPSFGKRMASALKLGRSGAPGKTGSRK